MNVIKKKDIDYIRNELLENKYKGIIFFISDENYSKYAKPLVSSLNLFAENWLGIYIHIGNFTFNFPYKGKLIEIDIDIPFEENNYQELRTYCANVRVLILYQLTTQLNLRKIVYTDIDNILIRDLNRLFNKENFYIRKVNLNLVDKILHSSPKIMYYKSGVIILKSDKGRFLKDKEMIIYFVNEYLKFCLQDFDKWFADQIALTKTFENLPVLAANSCFDKKVCDWDLSPFSFFWAAKGYIKKTILWKIISKKVIFFWILKKTFKMSKNKLLVNLILILDSGLNFFIFPFIVFRYKFFDYIFRLIRYLLKRIYN
jgi:hypothetical protein